MAAFNGGFRFQDAHGGFYLDGRQAVPLQAGAASVVIYANGHIDIGHLGQRGDHDPPRQRRPAEPGAHRRQRPDRPRRHLQRHPLWGATLGANTVVARSGIGVTATGALVYVAGPALTARSLAESLQRAGAVRAMALDINPEWVTFNFYHHARPADPGHGDQALPPDATTRRPLPGADPRVPGLLRRLAARLSASPVPSAPVR